MQRLLVALLALAVSAFAANFKLYLKDGSYQLVREYSVKGDRVRFYSVERSEWEEVPVSLVDLKRTDTEVAAHKAEVEKEAKEISAEEKFERAMAEEVSRIPMNTGVYYMVGKEAKSLKQAESQVHTSKGRSILKILAPIPIVTGKGTVELQGERSTNVFQTDRPEFYIRLAYQEHFGIIKLKPERGVRVAEKITIIPVSKETIEEPELVETYRKELADGLYRIWPVNPLQPGEYAVVEYTPGKLNIQIWDFAYQPGK